MEETIHTHNLKKRIEELEKIIAQNKLMQFADLAERFKVFSSITSEGILLTENGYCIDANERVCHTLGFKHHEIIGKFAPDFIVPEYRQDALKKLNDKSETPYESVAINKDGIYFPIEIKAKNLDYKGREVRAIVIRDISDQKKTQFDLALTVDKFKEVIDNAGDGILIGNTHGIIIEVNIAFLKMTGFSKEELIGQHISSVFTPESITNFPLRFDLLNSGQSILMERDIRCKDGKSIPCEMNSKRPNDNYYLSIIRDLSERKNSEKEIIKAKEKAEESDRLKSAFIANMSHEIRTPMNGILGFTELLKNENIDPLTRQDYVQIIANSGQQLLNIINDVLEISRIETGQTTLNLSCFDIVHTVQKLAGFFHTIATQNNNQIFIEINQLDDNIFYGDEAKVQQILTNLINNSLKFTSNGKVTIGLTSSHDSLILSVEDTGIGIPINYQKSIFERFIQADHKDNKIYKGTGLGLAICQKLTLLMEGEIWMKSEENIGTVFYVKLPFLAHK